MQLAHKLFQDRRHFHEETGIFGIELKTMKCLRTSRKQFEIYLLPVLKLEMVISGAQNFLSRQFISETGFYSARTRRHLPDALAGLSVLHTDSKYNSLGIHIVWSVFDGNQLAWLLIVVLHI